MEQNIKKETFKQYLHYFRIWFILLAILAIIAIVLKLLTGTPTEVNRQNFSADAERVFDYANVLSDTEEQNLRTLITEYENTYHMDIVMVTINEPVENQGNWETVMANRADDFYDYGNYGYNKVHGDGILILDNWYEDEKGSQKGTWLSTCGNVYASFSTANIDDVLDEVYYNIDYGAYNAYTKAIKRACNIYDNNENFKLKIPNLLVIILPIIVAIVFATAKLHTPPAKDTTTTKQYVLPNSIKMKKASDTFTHKSVTFTKVQTDRGSSSSHSSSGHGGGHISSSGVSHGGGGRRR